MLSFPIISYGDDEWFSWDEGNTVLQVPMTVVIAMDLGTTLDITRHPDRYEEVNPLLGKHPPQNRVWSHGFQVGVIGVEAYWVNHNLHIGLRVKF